MTVASYELAMQRIDIEFDVPQFDVSGLVRVISENAGHLPADKRDRYAYLPERVVLRIEEIVREAFNIGE